ncbi:hypothetical protein KAR91_65680 [Candidatus Pacearchaeota archaeon]|nr:hypothetical protein [Candidatus Pacearchaeota archaeon]
MAAIVENSQDGFVRRVREKLQLFPNIFDSVMGSPYTIAVGDTYFSVNDYTNYKVGDFIEIEDEILKVSSTVDGGAVPDKVYAERGARMTEAAAHAAGKEIKVCGLLWTDVEIKKLINDAIIALRPEISYTAIDESLTTLESTREYTIPAAISEVSWVETERSTGVFLRERRARIRGNKLTFDYQPDVGDTIRLIGWRYQDPFSVTVTELSLGQEFWEMIIQYATALAMESTLTNRARFTEYSASLNPRASTTDEITRTVYYFKNQFRISKNEKAPRKCGYSHRPHK